MPIKNLKKLAARLARAVKDKEKIVIYGDADPDGIASVIILKEAIKNLGGEVALVYLLDREREGYGLNWQALKVLKKEAPALLFVLDCGISNFEEVAAASKIGFEVVIVDHHETLGRLPKASLIVDPKQKGDKYSFKNFATAGLLYKLTELLFDKEKSPGLCQGFLELAALATIADMMPKEEDNKVLIEEGVQLLPQTLRPGLRAFFDRDEMQGLNPYQVIAKIIPALNAGQSQDHLNESYLLLTTSDKEEAERGAEKLIQKSRLRKQKIEAITKQVAGRVSLKKDFLLVFEGDPSWPITLLGPVASKICNEYKKPTFIYSQAKDQSVGAVRMPKDLNGVKAMESCSQGLRAYGGHPPAAGFTVANENLEEFEKCLERYFQEKSP